MRRALAILLLVLGAVAESCGGRFTLPVERKVVATVPTDKSYHVLQTWRGLANVRDVEITRGAGSQLLMLFNNPNLTGPPSVPRGDVRLYPFTQPTSIGPPIFDPPRGLFNPIALAVAGDRMFVLDEGDSCQAKYDPVRGTCEADSVRNGRRSQVFDYNAVWRVREYAVTGGDTISTFADTSVGYVHGIAADDQGNVYVSTVAVVLDTLSTDPRERTRKFISRIYRYIRGPRYPGIVPNDINMPGANWHRDSTWAVLDGTGGSSVNDPRGIAWTPIDGGALFVADKGNNKAKLIGTFAPNIALAKMDGSETPNGTSFNAPSNVAVDGSGFLYVVDRANQRVLRYDSYGNYQQDVNVELNNDNPPVPLLDPVAVGVDDSLAYVGDAGRGQVIRYKRRP